MHARDKAVLRLCIGLGLACALAYGFALPLPYVSCILAVIVLSKPGPPLPFIKGLIVAALFAGFVLAGVLMVPLLEHYAFAGILITALIVFALVHAGQISGSPATTVLLICFALIPVAGVAEQALVSLLSISLATGFAVGTLVSGISSRLFPDPVDPKQAGKQRPPPDHEEARWIALRTVVIVMPVFVLALTNPSFYLAAVMKTVTLGQQASELDARSAGRELIGSTLMGAIVALAVWCGLSLWATLWMLVLWLMAAALWTGSGMLRTRQTRYRPSFWSNALITALILLGPAIEDSASGKSVLLGSAMRTSLFVGVALYAWATIWLLERWHAPRTPSSSDLPEGEIA
ncbi:MAG TPA: DUF2955 domain-containing protein [Rhodocyclaceae bacterium]|nr:DUF2955 domain-containing protein [Rhodocyclaceae bacterium]